MASVAPTPEGNTNTDSKAILAGAARFVTAFEQHGKDTKLVLFSGDLFSPSHCKKHRDAQILSQDCFSLSNLL